MSPRATQHHQHNVPLIGYTTRRDTWQSMLDRLVEVVQEGENPGRSRGG